MNDLLSDLQPESLLSGLTGKGISVAILDSGLDLAHPMMEGVRSRLKSCGSFLTRSYQPFEPPTDPFGHGTPVSWIVNDTAPEAEIHFIRVLSEDGTCEPEVFHGALEHVIKQEIRVVNLSLGLDQGVNDYWRSRFLELVDQAYYRDITLVAAASNNFDWIVPASFSSVVSVNSDYFKDPLAFRLRERSKVLYGPKPRIWLDAQGDMVRAPRAGTDSHFYYIGTSFAAPRVAGIVALLLERYPDLKPFEVKTLLYRLGLYHEGQSESKGQ